MLKPKLLLLTMIFKQPLWFIKSADFQFFGSILPCCNVVDWSNTHSSGIKWRSYSGLYMGKPIHSRHDNGIPLKTALCTRQSPVPVSVSSTLSIVPSRASLWLPAWFSSDIASPLSMIWGWSVLPSLFCPSAERSENTAEQREEERAAAPLSVVFTSCSRHWRLSDIKLCPSCGNFSSEDGVRLPSACPLALADGLT